MTTPSKPATPAAPAASVNSYERQGAQRSEEAKFDSPTQDVDLAKGVATGIALPDARGIEQEPPARSIQDVLSEEAFFAQHVEVTLSAPGDAENDASHAEITVNGERVTYLRDDQTVHSMKRYHLAQLAGAKTQKVVQKKITAADGSMGYENKTVLQALYPFSVVHDPSGRRGHTWLKQLLQRSA